MSGRVFVLAVAAGLLALPARAQELSPKERQKLIEQYYQKAFEQYKKGEFTRAVDTWTEVLKLDRYQTAASELIDEARKKITEKNAEREAEVFALVAKGEYGEASLKLERLMGDDPTNPRYRSLRARLSKISRHFSTLGQGRGLDLVKKALGAYLSPDPNFQFAFNALRYARDLDPNSKSIQGLLADFEEENRDLARYDSLTPGMTFMEYKQIVALNNIYEGKYHLAVRTCNEILELEPKDVVALKRLGSAYYALGVKDRARDAWQKALAIAPGDEQLQKFLGRTPKPEPKEAPKAPEETKASPEAPAPVPPEAKAAPQGSPASKP